MYRKTENTPPKVSKYEYNQSNGFDDYSITITTGLGWEMSIFVYIPDNPRNRRYISTIGGNGQKDKIYTYTKDGFLTKLNTLKN